MNPTPALTLGNVELWNDTFAREHDINDDYARSGSLIRWVEGRRLAAISAMVAAEANDSVLEVGCGGGHVLRLFPQANLTGIDVSGEMLAKARQNLRGYRVELLKGELDALDLPDRSFDKIVCSEVLEHVVDPQAVLRGIQRLLRPDGCVVITFSNEILVNKIKRVIRKCGLTLLSPSRHVAWGGDHYQLHAWRVSEMHELLSRFFEIQETRFAPSRLMPIRCCFRCTAS